MAAGALAAFHQPLTALALLAAGALAAELLEEPERARVREPIGAGVFRVSSGVDLAAVIVLGPWRGALVAGSAALLARLVRAPLAARRLRGVRLRARVARGRLRLRSGRRPRGPPRRFRTTSSG